MVTTTKPTITNRLLNATKTKIVIIKFVMITNTRRNAAQRYQNYNNSNNCNIDNNLNQNDTIKVNILYNDYTALFSIL